MDIFLSVSMTKNTNSTTPEICQAHTYHHEAYSYFASRYEGKIRRSSVNISKTSGENNFCLISWSIFNRMEVNYNVKPSCTLCGTETRNRDLNLLL